MLEFLEMDGFFAIIGAAVAILCTGIVNYFLKRQEFAQQRIESDRRERLRIIERFHSSLASCAHDAGALTGEIVRLRIYDVSSDEKLKMFGIAIARFSQEVKTASSLQRLYFPDLGPQWKAALQTAQKFTFEAGQFAAYGVNEESLVDLSKTFGQECMKVATDVERHIAGLGSSQSKNTITPGISV